MSLTQIHVVEVGPRDGFQMEATFIPTDLKVEVIDLLGRAGIEKIEATSFVSPKLIPQMRDADEVMSRIRRFPGIRHTALVPNVKGAQRAIEAGAEAVRVVICLSESYNRRNVGLGISESLENCRRICEMTKNHDIGCEAILALAFGCPLEGVISEERVVGIANQLIGMGFGELSIADSIGVANPAHVRRLIRRKLLWPITLCISTTPVGWGWQMSSRELRKAWIPLILHAGDSEAVLWSRVVAATYPRKIWLTCWKKWGSAQGLSWRWS